MIRKTKIVCTIGPASDSPEVLRNLMKCGMDIARLNFSHGNYEEHKARADLIKSISRELNKPVALLLDTKGPEVRTKTFEDGLATLVAGEEVRISHEDIVGNNKCFSVTYKDLHKDLRPGNHILIDDGLIELEVQKIENRDLICQVMVGGIVSNNKSINLPEVELHLPAVTEKDIADLKFAVQEDFDFIAASFVRKVSDVMELRRVLSEAGGSDIMLISKIENREGVNNFEAITQVSDGIMVARGDLGVEIPEHEVPCIQKRLIKACYRAGKPCITATQMLDSMIRNPRPTRAEVSDVANAIYDGTSAIMLSGETAMGLYPLESCAMMSKIAIFTERNIDYNKRMLTAKHDGSDIHSVADAVSHACCTTAIDLDAKAIVCVTHSGRTARMISKFRPACPILACTVSLKSQRQLSMSWGVVPYLIDESNNTDELFEKAVKASLDTGMAEIGDVVVLSGGTPTGMSGTTNTMRISNVGKIICRGIPIINGDKNQLKISGDAMTFPECLAEAFRDSRDSSDYDNYDAKGDSDLDEMPSRNNDINDSTTGAKSGRANKSTKFNDKNEEDSWEDFQNIDRCPDYEERISTLAQTRRNFILIAKNTDHSMLPLIRSAKAIITEDPNPIGHAVTAALALNIPIIYDASNATKLIKSGRMVVLDMDTGSIL